MSTSTGPNLPELAKPLVDPLVHRALSFMDDMAARLERQNLGSKDSPPWLQNLHVRTGSEQVRMQHVRTPTGEKWRRPLSLEEYQKPESFDAVVVDP